MSDTVNPGYPARWKPTKRVPDGDPRWCRHHKGTAAFERVTCVPVDPNTFHGTQLRIECTVCHRVDGDLPHRKDRP